MSGAGDEIPKEKKRNDKNVDKVMKRGKGRSKRNSNRVPPACSRLAQQYVHPILHPESPSPSPKGKNQIRGKTENRKPKIKNQKSKNEKRKDRTLEHKKSGAAGLACCTLDPSGYSKRQASRVRGWRSLRHAMQTRSSRPPADPVARKTRTVKAHSVPRKAALVGHGAMHEKWCHTSEEHKRRGGGEVPARVERAGREGRMPGKATQLLVTIRGRFGLKDPSSGMRTHSAWKRTRGVEVLVEVDIEGEAIEEEVDSEVAVARDGERVIESEPEVGVGRGERMVY
ncbi:hypothetical protein K438DRAFT_1771754 [Mycena galopus ATCC 62051]|nr:hypothetical protein K438DRAFT_1771754 [Mycena galopus ATCC 62051]